MVVGRWRRALDELDALDPRRPSGFFDGDWYRRTYPDVGTRGWLHFVRMGDAEGRSPGPAFDAEYYRRTHLPLETTRALTHYLAVGRRRGHAPIEQALTSEQSRHAINAALMGREQPILLLGNDAREAGAPLLLLDVAERLWSRGWSPVFLLNHAGPLFPRFTAIGPTMIAAEGWDLAALGAALPSGLPIIANTSWGALLADRLGRSSSTTVLVQEMTDYIVENDLLAPLGRAETVVASMPRTGSRLARLLPAGTTVTTILPGVEPPRRSIGGERRVRRRLAEEFGAIDSVYLGAGYADQRKGFDRFIEAARTIAVTEPDAVFVWIGDLGSWASEIADRAVRDGLQLALPGFRADAGDWYAAASVFLLTSRQDPGPTTVLHAAAAGVPFVGLRADIGIQDLHEIVEAIGEFVDDIAELTERAITVARSDTASARRRRADFIRDRRSIDRYVDDLERLLGVDATRRPRRAARLMLRRRLMAAAVAEFRVGRRLASAARWGVREARRAVRTSFPDATARLFGRRTSRLTSIGIADDPQGIAGHSGTGTTISEPDRIRHLTGGDRTRLASPELLTWLAAPADVHLVRHREPAGPALLRSLESAGSRVDRLTQYDVSDPPRWYRRGLPPPRPRRAVATVTLARPSIALAPLHRPVPSRSIGVFVHIYYVDLADRLADRIRLIDHPLRLYISTDDAAKAAQLRTTFPDADVRVMPNRGRDVAPKVFGFAVEHADHDLVLHLHSKRSPHRRELSDWFEELLDCLLPSTAGINAILALFAEIDRLGMVSPRPHAGLGDAMRWGPNRAIAEVLTWNRGWPPLPEDHRLAFAAGSMFWARSSALRPVQDLAIPFDAFTDSSAADGTVAHAVERLMGVSCEVAGLQQLFIKPSDSVPATASLTTEQVARLLARRRP